MLPQPQVGTHTLPHSSPTVLFSQHVFPHSCCLQYLMSERGGWRILERLQAFVRPFGERGVLDSRTVLRAVYTQV
jgi:hypothetical protein